MRIVRLIDANQFEVVSWMAQGGREYSNGFDDGVDYVVQKIDKAETVEAIPVGWLYQKMQQEGERDNILHAEYIKDLIFEWKKGQEDNK